MHGAENAVGLQQPLAPHGERRVAPSRTMWPVAILRDAASRLLRMRTVEWVEQGVIRAVLMGIASLHPSYAYIFSSEVP